MGKLEGKVAIVTGGGTGIGKGIAKGLLAEGARVVIASRNEDALKAAADDLGGDSVLAIPADVTDEVQVASMFDQTFEAFGRLDILVNNAGAFNGGPLDELSASDWDHVMAVNLRAPFSVLGRPSAR